MELLVGNLKHPSTYFDCEQKSREHMAQNIYDNTSFFAEYNKLPRSQEGLTKAPEWPDLRKMVGSVKGLKVLDLGCGYGWFCRWASENGAVQVTGFDISQRMLEKAEHDWLKDERIEYQRRNMDSLILEEERYDLVHSSLAFHYVSEIKPLFQKIYHSLRPGGRLVFSIEHPIFTAPLVPEYDHVTEKWSLSSYHDEGERTRHWLGEDVKKQHRTLTTYIEALLEPGFRLDAFKEWEPNEVELKTDWEIKAYRSVFLLMAATKPAK